MPLSGSPTQAALPAPPRSQAERSRHRGKQQWRRTTSPLQPATATDNQCTDDHRNCRPPPGALPTSTL